MKEKGKEKKEKKREKRRKKFIVEELMPRFVGLTWLQVMLFAYASCCYITALSIKRWYSTHISHCNSKWSDRES